MSEQERAEAREVLRKLENGEGIKTGVYLFFPAWLRNSMDREEQLIAENERLTNKHNISSKLLIKAVENQEKLEDKVAEQDKEIQRLQEHIEKIERAGYV